jgi:hypothetical protein
MMLQEIFQAEITYEGDIWIGPKAGERYEVSKVVHSGAYEVVLPMAKELEVEAYLDEKDYLLLRDTRFAFNGTHNYRLATPKWSVFVQWLHAYFLHKKSIHPIPWDDQARAYLTLANRLIDAPSLDQLGGWLWYMLTEEQITKEQKAIYAELMCALVEYTLAQ